MLEDKVILEVTNRDNGTVGYTIPDLGINRTFQAEETKKITMEELRKLSYLPGGEYILRNCLVIKDNDAIEELLGEVEPEYTYTEEDVKNLLLTGSLDELKDCLDFAPKGVVELVKKYAVELKINDIAKRKAIKDATGFNVDMAVYINEETSEERPEEKKERRVRTVSNQEVKASTGRRTAAPTSKYKITSIQE